MPTASGKRTIAASAEEVWRVVSDPHHLPRWWPRVERVEDVHDGEFTEVMRTKKGKTVRADYRIVESDEDALRVRWDQRLEGTPFAGVLSASETEVQLVPEAQPAAATTVTIEMRQTLSGKAVEPVVKPGLSNRFTRGGAGGFGGRLVRRAAHQTINEALDGLERISV